MPKPSLTLGYIVVSFAVIAMMAYDEGSRHRAFFPTVAALTANNLFHVALANGYFAALYTWAWCVSRLFLGKLSQQERRRVSERFFVLCLDTALAIGMFRTALNYWTVVQVSGAVTFRVLHQMATVRLDTLEQALQLTTLGVLRFLSYLSLLFAADVFLTLYFLDMSLKDGMGLSTFLGVEFIVMGVVVLGIAVKMALFQYEQARGGYWDMRGTLRFYCDIGTEAASCLLYICFFIAMAQSTFMPFHVIRHVLDNSARLMRAIKDCTTYRKLIAKLDRLGDPTEAQLEGDRSCSVCLGDIDTPAGAKRLPCGHCFHNQCLTRWLERNNTCPYCRQEIEAMLAREAARNANQNMHAPAAPNAPANANDNAGGNAAPGGRDWDPLEALQDEEAIRQVYQQYLAAHRLEAGAAAAAAAAREARDQPEAARPAQPAEPAAQPAAAAAAATPARTPAPAAAPTAAVLAPAESAVPTPTTDGGDTSASARPRVPPRKLPGMSDGTPAAAPTNGESASSSSDPRTAVEAYERYHAAIEQAERQLRRDLDRLKASA